MVRISATTSVDHPAYAWAESVWVDGNTLKASLKEVDPQFAQIVKAGRYKRISAAFFAPDDKNNPTPGQYSLRHIGFLGAVAPAVNGLKVAEFAQSDDDYLCFSIPTEVERFRSEKRLLQLEKNNMFLEGLISEGKFLPCNKDRAMSFMFMLDNSQGIEFADCDGEKTMLEFFKDFLARTPEIVPLGRVSMDEAKEPSGPSFSAPDGENVDRDGMRLHAQAMQIMREQGVSFEDAVDMLYGD